METAEEFFKNNSRLRNDKTVEDITSIMIEFAKEKVKEALEDIYEKAKHGDEEHQKWLKEFFDNYSLENIK